MQSQSWSSSGCVYRHRQQCRWWIRHAIALQLLRRAIPRRPSLTISPSCARRASIGCIRATTCTSLETIFDGLSVVQSVALTSFMRDESVSLALGYRWQHVILVYGFQFGVQYHDRRPVRLPREHRGGWFCTQPMGLISRSLKDQSLLDNHVIHS